MYVCVCKAVTERDIHGAAAEGASRLRDLRKRLGVTSECNQCACAAKRCLDAALGGGTSSRKPLLLLTDAA
ncbi:MAG: (2Fe-2S)-binding protein [Rhodocyclaceae bacterium]|nr:(2Fe-2S)-binding protein [Rhodocyclaceae bacterium]